MFAKEPAAGWESQTSDLLSSRCNSQLQSCWSSAGGNIRLRRSRRLEVLPADSLKEASALGNIKKTSLLSNKWQKLKRKTPLKVWQSVTRRGSSRRLPVGGSQSQTLLVTLEPRQGHGGSRTEVMSYELTNRAERRHHLLLGRQTASLGVG